MLALLVRAHETDTNAWYLSPHQSPRAGPALSVDSAAAVTPIIDGVGKVPKLG
jgi:hypothetical protein